MKVIATYDEYSSLIENAVIPINEDKSYNFELTTDELGTKRLKIKAENTLLQEEITLNLTSEETKQFVLLLTQFLRQTQS